MERFISSRTMINFMHKVLKSPREIEAGMVFTHLEKSCPRLIIDTSGLIDIVASCRQTILGKNAESEPIYKDPLNFLEYLASKQPIIVNEATHEEILRHVKVRINGNNNEIPEKVIPFVNFCYEGYKNLRKSLAPLVERDRAKYDVYWISKSPDIHNEKKLAEGFSVVDREILTDAIYIASSISENTRNFPIGIISSDTHILKSIPLLEKSGYFGIYALPTRMDLK